MSYKTDFESMYIAEKVRRERAEGDLATLEANALKRIEQLKEELRLEKEISAERCSYDRYDPCNGGI